MSISTNSGASFTNKTTANGLGSGNVSGVYAAGSTVYADSARCYLVLPEAGYSLEQVNHTAGEYARGEVYENSAEGEIMLLWRFLAHHRGVSLMNLPSYLQLHQFARNHRDRPH